MKAIKRYLRNKVILWINNSFKEYIDINWKDFTNREKDIALSVKSSFIIDIVKLFK
jgi:hypothetical protein